MSPPQPDSGMFRFGPYEADTRTGELRKYGLRVQIQEKSFELLVILLKRPGELVSREELARRLWPDGIFVDFDNSLNSAVNRLRDALRDGARHPRFIETLARRGYRFIAPVDLAAPPATDPVHPAAAPRLDVANAPDRRPQKHVLWLSATLVVALAAVTLGWLFLQPAPSADLCAIPLTALPGIASSPSFSPDGSRVAFAWNGNQQDNYEIYVKQIGTSALVRLTSDPAPDTNPAWSPDDRYIAFRRLGPDRAASIMLAPAIGGPERKIAEMLEIRGPFSWTPDAKWLAVSATESIQERPAIWLISAGTGDKRRLTRPEPGGADFCPSISPDGTMLAFGRETGTFVARPYVLRLAPDGKPLGQPRLVSSQSDFAVGYTHLEIPRGGIAWANSREIVYSAGGAQTFRLWRVPVSGDRPRGLLNFAADSAQAVAISTVKRRLVYEWYQSNVNLWRLDTRTRELKPLIVSRGEQRLPEYSPDGRRIAFQSNRSGSLEIWTCHSDGSNCVQLTFFGGFQTGTPRWSPDGRWLVFDTRADGTSQLRVVASDGGDPRRLTFGPAVSTTPHWSRDGRWIYFLSNRSGRDQVWRIGPQGGEPEQVTRLADGLPSAAGAGSRPAEAPDGKSIYYVKTDSLAGPLFQWLLDGGGERQVIPLVATPASWWVTDKGIYYVAPDTPLIVRIYEFSSGKSHSVGELRVPLNGGMCVSPDDAYALVTQTDHRTSDLMLVENFR